MNKKIRLIALLTCDAILTAASVYLSYLLRFDFNISHWFVPSLTYVIPIYTALTLISLFCFRIYRRIWQYTSVGDIIAILKGTAVGTLAFFCLHYLVNNTYPSLVVPRSIYFITIMISFLFISGSRFVWRILRDNYVKIQPYHRRALVIGAGEAGIMVVRELKHNLRSELYPVVFLDDDVQKLNCEVMGIPVVGTRNDIHNTVKQYNIDEIIVAIPTAPKADIVDIINRSKNSGCQIKIVPKVNDLIHGKVSINAIRDVSVEDLLGREPIQLDMQGISNYLKNQIVLVTGAGGSIGSELCRQIIQFDPKSLLLLGRGENSIYEIELELRKKNSEITIVPLIADVQDKERLKDVFQDYLPQVVFHAAAHKHVPLMEANPLEAIKNNVLGTNNIAECAHEFGAERFVMVSTDKAVNPTNVMGASKRAAEMIVQSLDQISQTRFASVRFGNVLGSRGSVIPLFKRQIREGGPVTVTDPNMIRYFMTIPEAVQLVIQTGALASGGEVFILDMGKPVRINDLARDLISLSGFEPDKEIKIVYTGIRPGEKLYEELLTSEEGATGTKYDRIYVGKPSNIPYKNIKQMLEQFESLLHRKPLAEDVKQKLREWVPTYQEFLKERKNSEINEAFQASLEIVAAIDDK